MRKVIMLPVAEQDLTVIVEYLAQFYESTALRQYDRIVKKIKELPLFPERLIGQALTYTSNPVSIFAAYHFAFTCTLPIIVKFRYYHRRKKPAVKAGFLLCII